MSVLNANPVSNSANPLSNGRLRIQAVTTLDDKFAGQRLDALKAAFQQIQSKNKTGLRFEELYKNAYTLVFCKQGERLHSGMKATVEEHLRKTVRPRVVESITGGQFLDTLNDAWNDHVLAMAMIGDVLLYLDRVYAVQTNTPTVNQLGTTLFREEIIRKDNVTTHLRTALLAMIAEERAGKKIDWLAIKNACSMLVALGSDAAGNVYAVEFEAPFLADFENHYKGIGQKLIGEKNAANYVRKVEEHFESEATRAKNYLGAGSEEKMLVVLENALITAHMKEIVEMEGSGVVAMLDKDKIDDLRRVHKLLKRVGQGMTVMTGTLSGYLRKKGEAIVAENGEMSKNPVEFLQALLNLKDQFDNFLHNAFRNDRLFKQTIQADFEHFVNKNKRSSEFLSLFMDDKMKTGNRELNDAEMETLLDKAMVLFRFVQEKDVFEKYYKTHMMRRLLNDRSVSDDAEKALIGKLKSECGCQFTQKLESMLRDKDLWNADADGFKKFRISLGADANKKDPMNIDVRVLTSATWPVQLPATPANLPVDCQTSFKTFEEYYLKKHSGRKLTIVTQYGAADVRAIFYGAPEAGGAAKATSTEASKESDIQTAKPTTPTTAAKTPVRKETQKILAVNTYQMIILLRFNHKDKFTYSQLLADTQIPDKDLKRNLQSMAMGKADQRVLSRSGKGKEIEAADEFSVNDGFTSPLNRVKIQMISSKVESEPERKETKGKVDANRKHEVEAAIVRIMKARKKLAHSELMIEVTNQLKHRFVPDPALIKKHIDALLEKDYLARDKDDNKMYNYVA